MKGEGNALANLGNVYESWGQYDKAIDYYEKDLAICRKLDRVGGEGLTLNYLGRVYATQGQVLEALTSFRKGLEIFKKIGVSTDWATDNIGNLYLDSGEVQKAEPFIEEGGTSLHWAG